MTVYQGQVTVTPPGGSPSSRVAATVEPAPDALSISPGTGDPIRLRYTDVDELVDHDFTLSLGDHTGRTYELSMLGKAYEQVVSEIKRFRRDQLQHDLLLTGIGSAEAFPGAVCAPGEEPEKAELRLFDDLLVAMPEHSLMWGIPYSFVDSVTWDPEAYRVKVTDDLGEAHEFGWLAKRSEGFVRDLQRRLDALARRTSQTLDALIPGLAPDALSRLAAAMRDGRAVQQRTVDAIDPSIWPRLEEVVVKTDELRATYDALKAMTPPGWAAFGVKAMEAEEQEDLPQVTFTGAGDRDQGSGHSRSDYRDQRDQRSQMAGRGLPPGMAQMLTAIQGQTPGAAPSLPSSPPEQPAAQGAEQPAGGSEAGEVEPEGPKTWLWYFTPLAREGRPINAVAQEVTSESGHATYLYRLMDQTRFDSLSGEALADAVGEAIARLNRALLTLNFRREPIYLPDDQITQGRYTRYAVALRKLEYLQWARRAFLGRAIHKDDATWRSNLDQALGRM